MGDRIPTRLKGIGLGKLICADLVWLPIEDEDEALASYERSYVIRVFISDGNISFD